ncbi:MAG: lipid-binding SYLF domain-containing protein [Proteobacteria bacterium]|nr:lipid-binding SYLF domain-containing protein [Pseudomonadota bacterium]
MRSLTSALVMFCLFGLGINTALAWNANAVKNCNITIGEFKKKDKKLDNFFTQAYGYAVFPSVGKGAIGIGGAHGNGVVYEKGKPIGDTSLTQITIGFQLGGQAYSEIIFFKDKKTLDDFKNGNFELGAQASAVAVTAGASADANYEKGVAVFTMAKGGLMYEASVGGQKFSYDPY